MQCERGVAVVQTELAPQFHLRGEVVPGDGHIDTAAFLGIVIRHHGVIQAGRHYQSGNTPHHGGQRENGQEPEPGLSVPGGYGCFISHYASSRIMVSGPYTGYQRGLGPTKRLSVSRFRDGSVSDSA